MPERTTTRRRQLGAMMRKLRARKGLTLEEAGKLVGVSKATVSRYETQAGPVKWIVVDALCREYGATDAERAAIVRLAKDAKQQGWWSSFADSIPESMNLLLTLEDEAVHESHFACVYVPGLLQTRAYSTALQKANEVPLEPAEIERLVDIRMKRQDILSRPKPPRLWAILDESVIRRLVGSLNDHEGTARPAARSQRVASHNAPGLALLQRSPRGCSGKLRHHRRCRSRPRRRVRRLPHRLPLP